MQDLTLDFDNKTITNTYQTGKNLIMQKVVLALQCWSGDWFLDGDFGIPYDIRSESKSLLSADVEDVILSVDGVNSVQDLKVSNYYRDNKLVVDISATVITDLDEVFTLNGLVPVIGV